MKLELIKNALKARTLALNVKPVSVDPKIEENIAPVAPVAVKPQVNSVAEVEQKVDKPVVTADDKEKAKNTAATAPVQPTLILTEDKGDSVKPEPIKKSDSESEKPIKQPIKVEGVIPASQLPNQPVPVPVKPEAEEKPVVKKPARPRKKAETEPVTVPAVKESKPPEMDIETVIRTHLKAGVDFDVIPNCGRKPTLLKAGAEHLASIYGFRTTSEIVNRVEVLDKNFVLYEFKTTVYKNGEIVSIGYGSCNTLERKFIKQGFATALNTVIKIARKRSFVDAVLTATSASRIFTQDIEELRESATIIPIDTK